jgi:hypothetical protein
MGKLTPEEIAAFKRRAHIRAAFPAADVDSLLAHIAALEAELAVVHKALDVTAGDYLECQEVLAKAGADKTIAVEALRESPCSCTTRSNSGLETVFVFECARCTALSRIEEP